MNVPKNRPDIKKGDIYYSYIKNIKRIKIPSTSITKKQIGDLKTLNTLIPEIPLYKVLIIIIT